MSFPKCIIKSFVPYIDSYISNFCTKNNTTKLIHKFFFTTFINKVVYSFTYYYSFYMNISLLFLALNFLKFEFLRGLEFERQSFIKVKDSITNLYIYEREISQFISIWFWPNWHIVFALLPSNFKTVFT